MTSPQKSVVLNTLDPPPLVVVYVHDQLQSCGGSTMNMSTMNA